MQFFNRMGVVGWYLNSVLLRRTRVPSLPAPAPEPPGAPPAGRGGRPPAIRAVPGRRRAPVLSRPGPPRGRAEGLRARLVAPPGQRGYTPSAVTRSDAQTQGGPRRRLPGGRPGVKVFLAPRAVSHARQGLARRGGERVLLWVAVRGVSLDEVLHQLRQVRPLWLVPVIASIFLRFWLTAIRWQLLLRPVKRVGIHRLFAITMIGFMANNVLPARLGEFVRAYALGRSEALPPSLPFATIVIERIFDGFTLLLFLVGGLSFLQPSRTLLWAAAPDVRAVPGHPRRPGRPPHGPGARPPDLGDRALARPAGRPGPRACSSRSARGSAC